MIAILAILIAFVSIWIKIYNHFKYLSLLPDPIDIPAFFGAISPFFFRNKEDEGISDELLKIAKSIKICIVMFYISIATFFIYIQINISN